MISGGEHPIRDDDKETAQIVDAEGRDLKLADHILIPGDDVRCSEEPLTAEVRDSLGSRNGAGSRYQTDPVFREINIFVISSTGPVVPRVNLSHYRQSMILSLRSDSEPEDCPKGSQPHCHSRLGR